MKLMLNSTTKPYGFEPCFDSFGTKHGDGEYFTPENSPLCTKCVCENGKATQCIALQCQIPKCKNYEQIPGRCCEYTCPRDFVLTDKSTVAVVVSLSIILVVILVAITMVWRKIRRKEKYHRRLETVSTGSSQQETDLESLIQKHSIPNNLRKSSANSNNKHGQSSEENSANPLLLTNHDSPTSSSPSTSSSSSRDHDRDNNKLLNHCVNKLNSRSCNRNAAATNTMLCTTLSTNQAGSNTKTVVALPPPTATVTNELHLNEKGKYLASFSSSSSKSGGCARNNNDINGGNGGVQQQHEACCSSRRFEPPPPYSPSDGHGHGCGMAAFV